MFLTAPRFPMIIAMMLMAGIASIAGGSPVSAQGQPTLTINALDCISPGPDARTADPNDCDGTPGADIEFSVGNFGTDNGEIGVTDENGSVTFGLTRFDLGPESQVLAAYTPLSNPAGEIVAFDVACYDAGGAAFATETFEGETPPGVPPAWGILFTFEPEAQITCDWTSWLLNTGTVDPTPIPDDGDSPPPVEGPTENGWNREILATLCAEPPPGPEPIYAPYEGCEAAEGVTMIATNEAGDATFGTCDTTSPSSAAGAASCFLVIPFDTAAVITQNPATLPEGYVPLTEMQTFQAPAANGPSGALERNLFVNVAATAEEPDPPAGDGSVTIYTTACPPGYEGDAYFEDCYENPRSGVEFSATNVKSSFEASGTTGAAGFVTLPLPDELAGDLASVSEVPPLEVPGGAEPPFVVYCTRNAGQPVGFHYGLIQLDPGGDAYNVEIGGIAQGDQIRCDWYTLPAADAEPTPSDPPRNGIEPGGIGLPRADWETVYGEGEVTASGAIYENVTFPGPGQHVLVRTGEADWIHYLEFTYESGSQLGGAPVADVQAQVAGAVPADAELVASFSLPATPDGPTPLRAELWESGSLAETTGGSGSILVIYEEKTARQNPSSPEQTVVSRVRMTIADAE